MTLDEWVRRRGWGALSELARETQVSRPTIRKMLRREAVRADAALKVAEFIGCDYRLLSNPKPRRKLARKAHA